MNKKAIYAHKILALGKLIEDHVIIFENGIISDLFPIEKRPKGLLVEEISEGYLVPGFFDIQVNGGGGFLFNDDPSLETIQNIGSAHRKFGTTSFFPTLISDDLDKIAAAISAVDQAIAMGVPGVVGIHIEGPFLNEKKKGIHDAGKFKCLDEEAVQLLSSLKSGKTLVTLAPEINDPQFITKLTQSGVTVAAGHTNGTYEQTIASIEAGVTGFTHLFNAMSAFQSREPGAVGAAFEMMETWASVIADGFHVHPAVLRHAIKTKGTDKIILITDAMPTVGSQKKEFWLGNEHIKAKDGKCTNADGVLAGSDLDMASAVKYITEHVGFSLEQAIEMASRSPAKFMKLENEVGSIAIGKKANFALLDDKLDVLNVWIEGVQY